MPGSVRRRIVSMYHPETAGAAVSLLEPPARRAGALGFLCIQEPLDLEHSGAFLDRARALCRTCHCLVVNLDAAEFVDSAGVRALLALAGELETAGKELRLVVRPGSRVERTLSLLRLLERFHTCRTLEEACRRAPAS